MVTLLQILLNIFALCITTLHSLHMKLFPEEHDLWRMQKHEIVFLRSRGLKTTTFVGQNELLNVRPFIKYLLLSLFFNIFFICLFLRFFFFTVIDGKKDKKEGEAESSEGAASGEGGAAK